MGACLTFLLIPFLIPSHRMTWRKRGRKQLHGLHQLTCGCSKINSISSSELQPLKVCLSVWWKTTNSFPLGHLKNCFLLLVSRSHHHFFHLHKRTHILGMEPVNMFNCLISTALHGGLIHTLVNISYIY